MWMIWKGWRVSGRAWVDGIGLSDTSDYPPTGVSMCV